MPKFRFRVNIDRKFYQTKPSTPGIYSSFVIESGKVRCTRVDRKVSRIHYPVHPIPVQLKHRGYLWPSLEICVDKFIDETRVFVVLFPRFHRARTHGFLFQVKISENMLVKLSFIDTRDRNQ